MRAGVREVKNLAYGGTDFGDIRPYTDLVSTHGCVGVRTRSCTLPRGETGKEGVGLLFTVSQRSREELWHPRIGGFGYNLGSEEKLALLTRKAFQDSDGPPFIVQLKEEAGPERKIRAMDA